MDAKNLNNLDKRKEIKPQKKKAPAPVIRQTITSYKRMMKANPLLELEMKGINVNEYINELASKSINVKPEVTTTGFNAVTQLEAFKKPFDEKPLMRTESLRRPKPNASGLNHRKPVFASKPSVTFKSHSQATTHSQKANSKDIPAQIRRTYSKGCISHEPANIPSANAVQNKATQTKVDGNLKDLAKPVVNVDDVSPSVSPIAREKSSNLFTFNTPQAYKRRSVSFLTPQSTRKHSFLQASTPAPANMKKLQDRLNTWLKSRGKPPVLYKNMRLFDIEARNQCSQKSISEENKENLEVDVQKSSSYESLKICETTISPEHSTQGNENGSQYASSFNHENVAKYAKEAMKELLTLIDEDYPRSQCLAWLDVIKKKYNEADNEPEYWECRAAIEQSAGNIQNAVQFYEAAIIQGAEVNSVNKSLDQLLKKFSLLNISLTELEPKNRDSTDRERIVKEARNIFKSTIINFAVGVRNRKKGNTALNAESKLFVTPVKRSTRISRGGYANTPGLTLCNTLRDLGVGAEDIQFQKNNALI